MAAADDDQTGGSQRPPRKRPPTHGNPDADPVLVHRRYVEQRLWSGNTERADSGVEDNGVEDSDVEDSDVEDSDVEDSEADDAEDEHGEPDGTGPSVRTDDVVQEQDLEDLARERYARALDQWHDLPGAVSRPPAEVSGAEAVEPDANDTDDTDDTDESSP